MVLSFTSLHRPPITSPRLKDLYRGLVRSQSYGANIACRDGMAGEAQLIRGRTHDKIKRQTTPGPDPEVECLPFEHKNYLYAEQTKC